MVELEASSVCRERHLAACRSENADLKRYETFARHFYHDVNVALIAFPLNRGSRRANADAAERLRVLEHEVSLLDRMRIAAVCRQVKPLP